MSDNRTIELHDNATYIENYGDGPKKKEEKAKAESRVEEQEKELRHIREENDRLRNEIKDLQAYKEKAYRELCRIRDEQKTFGKIHVNTEL